MLGLHNILFIAPPPSSSSSFPHLQPPPNLPSDHSNIANTTSQDPWTTLKKYQEESSFPKRVALNFVDEGHNDHNATNSSGRVCRDCGNRAKKECDYRRCRTCCKSRGYDCSTHLKSTWVPVAKRRERLGSGTAADSSASSSGGGGGGGGCRGKRPRENATATSNSVSTSNNNNNNNAAAASSFSLDTGSSFQDASFKKSLPGQVRAPAVFRCVRVTAINSGEAEVAYQAMVNISGHVFKGFLYDQGADDDKNLFPFVSKLHPGEGNGDSTSPIVNPPTHAFAAASANQRLLQGND